MDITEVRIKLMEDPNDRLQAFCSITFDSMFVIRDLKIIQGTRGPFVAMPSRKLTDRCSGCGNKNDLRARYCNQCGVQLKPERAMKDDDGRARLYADIAHPINSRCREMIQNSVLQAFHEELVNSKKPGYVCRYDDYGEEQFAQLYGEPEQTNQPPVPVPAEEVAPETADSHISPTNNNGSNHTKTSGMDSAKHRLDPAAQASDGPHQLPDGSNRQEKVTSRTAVDVSDAKVTDNSEVFGAGIE